MLANTSKWTALPPFISCQECSTQVQGPTSGLGIVSGVLLVECSTVRCAAYPCGWRGAALWRFGAKRWSAESRVTRSTRWQEYLFSSASPGLVIWLGITWEPGQTRTIWLAWGKSTCKCAGASVHNVCVHYWFLRWTINVPKSQTIA